MNMNSALSFYLPSTGGAGWPSTVAQRTVYRMVCGSWLLALPPTQWCPLSAVAAALSPTGASRIIHYMYVISLEWVTRTLVNCMDQKIASCLRSSTVYCSLIRTRGEFFLITDLANGILGALVTITGGWST